MQRTNGVVRAIEAARFRQSPAVITRAFADQVVLAAPGRSTLDQLAGTGAVTWHFLDAPRTLEDLVDRVAEFYSVPPATISSDIEGFLDGLITQGLVEEVIESDV